MLPLVPLRLAACDSRSEHASRPGVISVHHAPPIHQPESLAMKRSFLRSTILTSVVALFVSAVGCGTAIEVDEPMTIDPVSDVYGEHELSDTPDQELGEAEITGIDTMGEVDTNK